jgi:hypothetical protein
MEHIVFHSCYINKKHQTLYKFEKVVWNATNINNGQQMVLYTSVEDGSSYVREISEFLEKFEPYPATC